MATSPVIERPAHVPAHLVVDFDAIADTQHGARWQDGLAAIFEKVGPVFWTPRTGGHWVVGGYQAVFDLARDPETFSSDNRKYPPEKDNPVLIPLGLDPPEHSGYRQPITTALSPRIVTGMKDGIREYAASLVTGFAGDGHVDGLTGFAEPLPIVVFLRLLGLPTDRIGEFRDLMVTLLTAPVAADRGAALHRVGEICAPFIQQRMAERREDLISHLLDTEIDGRPISFEEVLGYCIMLFVAGLDTVVNALSFSLYHLAKDQPLQAQLRADPSLIPSAIEEFLRRYSIVTNWRFVIQDKVLAGIAMKAKDKLLYCTPGANLDPSVYRDALGVQLGREERPHLAFMAGAHRCAGSHLARTEMAIGLEEFFKAIPTFRLDLAETVEPRAGFTYSLANVPLIWDVA